MIASQKDPPNSKELVMSDILASLANNLLVPTILFFVLGLIAAFVRSDLSIPKGAAKFMSLYLLLSIGFKGGVSMQAHGLNAQVVWALAGGIFLSFVLPLIGFALLRVMSSLDRVNAAAIAAHYGSISIVTFVTATSVLDLAGIPFGGYMIAVAAAMEVPAIISALWLANGSKAQGPSDHGLWRDILANGSVLLLLGAFAIGAVTGGKGMDMVEPFIVTLFTGILCLFLLDMGLNAGGSLIANRHMLRPGVLAFGLIMPVLSALLALGLGTLIGLEGGSLFLFLVLAASASYIAVPAAMQIALPQAESGIYLTLALGVTFPFNITVGLPLYFWLAM
jgi:hypothetical protein